MLELNRTLLLLFAMLIVVVLISSCVSIFLYFHEGHKTGWTFHERVKMMRAVLEEKYSDEYLNIFQQIFFFVQFKLRWTRFVVIVAILVFVLVGLDYFSNS